jgi:hypothetical protein
MIEFGVVVATGLLGLAVTVTWTFKLLLRNQSSPLKIDCCLL